MRRLYSPFASGLPGAGLLLLRLIAGIVLVAGGVQGVITDLAIGPVLVLIARIALGLLIIVGLWTPVAGVLIAVLELGWIVWRVGDPWIHVVLATVGIALAFLGPGAWSVDSRLFGWQRIKIDPRDRQP